MPRGLGFPLLGMPTGRWSRQQIVDMLRDTFGDNAQRVYPI